MTKVYLECTERTAFAAALEWPGWCRRTKTGELALDELVAYGPRYARVVASFVPGEVTVVGTLPGTKTTDFGAPDATGPWDVPPLVSEELERQVTILESCWEYLDMVVAGSPSSLRRGPRGGGRDRDAIADHVREAERAYAPKIGTRVPPRTPWPDQRALALAALRSGAPGARWPVGYALRRFAWHVLDHAWEIEDRRTG